MVDPVSLVSTIVGVVQLIGTAALTARQNKKGCLAPAKRARNLGDALPDFAKKAGNNASTVNGLERLKDALDEAFTLIESCQEGLGSSLLFSCVCSKPKAAELDSVNKNISNCLSDLNFFHQAQGGGGGGAASVGFMPTPPHHATGNVQWMPSPAPYPASPAPSRHRLSSFFTLPTLRKVFHRVFH